MPSTSSAPNAFEAALANGAARKLSRKEQVRRIRRTRMKKEWIANQPPIFLAKKLAEQLGVTGHFAWMEIFGNLEEKGGNKTKTAMTAFKRKLVDAKYPPEPWEIAKRSAKKAPAAASAESDGSGSGEESGEE